MTSRGRETEKKTKVRRTFNLRLRARLILAFALIALIPLTLLTVVVIEQTQSTVTSMVNATLTDQANRIAASIASSIQQLTYDLQNLAVNPSIEQLAVDPAHQHPPGFGPGRQDGGGDGRDDG